MNGAGAATEGSLATVVIAAPRAKPDAVSRCNETATIASNAITAPHSRKTALRENANPFDPDASLVYDITVMRG